MALLSTLRREPLVPFFLVGAALFAVDRAWPSTDPAHHIVVDDAFVRGLEEEAARRTGHEPDETQREALVDAWTREETLFRQARALGLDEGDLVVRRRLVQKIELLLAAEARWTAPTEDDVRSYFETHVAEERRPARTTITLCFFSRERGDVDARAVQALQTPDTMACDPHLPGDHFVARTHAQHAAAIGESVASAIDAAAVGAWIGPVEASRGVYLVRVDERDEARDATLDEVRDAIVTTLSEERRAAAIEAREREIASSYVVERAP